MEKESTGEPRHYHAALETAGWSFADEAYQKHGRIFVPGAGPQDVICSVDPELLDLHPSPVEAAEAEFDATIAAAEAAPE